MEVNIQREFLGLPRNPATHGHIFRRCRFRIWERFNRTDDSKGEWQQIIDLNILDALEVGYVYGQSHLRWKIEQIRD